MSSSQNGDANDHPKKRPARGPRPNVAHARGAAESAPAVPEAAVASAPVPAPSQVAAVNPTITLGAKHRARSTGEWLKSILKELKDRHINDLNKMARELEIEGASNLRKQELIFAILKTLSERGGIVNGEGTLETLPDGFGILESSGL